MSGAPEKAVCFGLSPGQLTTPSEPACELLVPAMLSGAILAAHDVSEGSSLCPPRSKRRLQPLLPRSKRRLQPLPPRSKRRLQPLLRVFKSSWRP